jgi:peptidoglycan/LPS O-acetylase OafA/YrhL
MVARGVFANFPNSDKDFFMEAGLRRATSGAEDDVYLKASPSRGLFVVSFSIQSNAAQSSKYRPDIDGLRGIAVLSVLLFHTGVRGFSGGFVGVDIFFVISGYLITSILLHDIQQNKFSLISFYDRRIRRIFPALFAVLLFCCLAATALLVPTDLVMFGKSVICASSFASNFLFLRTASWAGYFGDANQRQVLLHTWSLAVEEQFYLLFPISLYLMVRWTGQRARLCVAFIAGASFLASVWMTKHTPFSAFYLFLPRAWELLIGSLLALKAVPPLKVRWLQELAILAGVACMLIAVVTYSSDTPFPGAGAVLPCLGAWLCIYAGQDGSAVGTRILSFGPLVAIGVISYSLYLWHWPISVFVRRFFAVSSDFSSLQSTEIILSSLFMALLSYLYVERPFRGKESHFTRHQVFVLAFLATAVSLSAGWVFYKSHGLPDRYDQRTRQLIAENLARQEDYEHPCVNWRTDPESIADINFCRFGDDAHKKFFFWGDSHVQQLYPLIQKFFANGDLHGHGALLAIENGCAPFRHLNTGSQSDHCDKFADLAMSRAEQQDIDRVFIAFNARWSIDNPLCLSQDWKCVRSLSVAETREWVLEELSTQIRELKRYGKRVVVSLPFPLYDKSIPEVEIRNALFSRYGMGDAPKDLTAPEIRAEMATVARAAGAEVFDPRASLCSQMGCTTEIDGVSIYKDNNHLAASQVFILEDNLRQVLQ